MTDRNAERQSLSAVLSGLAKDQALERVSLRAIFDRLGDRAFGALLLVFALPNVLPTPPGTSAILGLPLVILSAQLAVGLAPWLPDFIADRSMAREDFARLVEKMTPMLMRAERLLKTRLPVLTSALAERAIGVLCLLMAIILTLPIPLGNIAPAAVICLFALALLEGDGLFALAGMTLALLTTGFLATVYIGLLKGAALVIEKFLL